MTQDSLPLVIGLDIGTRTARAGIFTPKGDLLSRGIASYDFQQPRPGWAEQDPIAVLQASQQAIRHALDQLPVDSTRIVGLAISGTAVTLVTCDQNGDPLAPALLWMDTRAHHEAKEISEIDSEWLRYTGGCVSPEWMLPKALWIRRHQRQLYERCARFCELTDWVTYRLSGEWSASLCTLSAEWSYVSRLGGWPETLLDGVGMPDLVQRLPERINEPGKVIGKLQPTLAQSLGLPSGLPIIQGLIDSYSAALGLNVLAPGRVIASLGTSSAYLAMIQEPSFDPGLLGPVPDAFGRGTWTQQGGQTSAGALVDWFIRQLGSGKEYATLDAEAALISPGADGLLALDCWQGSRTPYRDPLARGAFWGLSLRHTQVHLYRAVLESIAFGGRQILGLLAKVGVHADELWVCGGGTRSALLTRILADVTGIPLVLPTQPEAAILGVAICAAVGAGLFPDLRSAATQMTRAGDRIEPDRDAKHLYQAIYEEYLMGYPILKERFHSLAALKNL